MSDSEYLLDRGVSMELVENKRNLSSFGKDILPLVSNNYNAQSQAAQKCCHPEVYAWRAPRLLVSEYLLGRGVSKKLLENKRNLSTPTLLKRFIAFCISCRHIQSLHSPFHTEWLLGRAIVREGPFFPRSNNFGRTDHHLLCHATLSFLDLIW